MTVSNFVLKRALNLDKVIVLLSKDSDFSRFSSVPKALFSLESRFSRMRVGSVTRAFLVRIVVSVDRVGSVDRVDSVTRIDLGSKLFFLIGD